MTPDRLAELHELARAAKIGRVKLAGELSECLYAIERLQAELERLTKPSVLGQWVNGVYQYKGGDE